MVDTLALVAAYGLIVGGLYVYVGSQVAKREVPDEALKAQRMFLVWWYALGGTSLIGALNIILYKLDALHPGYYLAVQQVNLLAIVLALLGLLYYMIYIYTGSGKWTIPIIAFYGIFYVALLGLVAYTWNPPEAFTDNGWAIQGLPESDQQLSPAVGLVFVLLLLGPQIAAAVAFLRLGPKLEDVTQRYRVRMLGVAILFWFGVSAVSSIVGAATGTQLSEFDAWQYVQRIVSLTAVLTILAAYKPPKWVRQKYGVQPV